MTVSVGDGTAMAGMDFAAVSSFTLTIPARATTGSQTFTLTPTDDGVAEGAETLTVSGSTTGLSVDSATLTINDNDTASTKVTLSLNPTSVSEGAGGTTVTVTGTLDDAARATATSVTVLVGDGTAMAGMDFASVSSFTLTIPAKATTGSQTFTLMPTDDGVAEGAETLTVSGSAGRAERRLGDADHQRQRHGVDRDRTFGEPDNGCGGRGPDDGNGDRNAEQRHPSGRDVRDRVGGRRHGHGGDGLRGGLELHADHPRQSDERQPDVHPDTDRRRCGRGRRDADGRRHHDRDGADRRFGDADDPRQRHGVDEGHALAEPDPRVGGRRQDHGDGDRNPG